MTFSYFPGCTLKTKGARLDRCAQLAAKALGFTLEELPEWQCCGAVYPMARDEVATRLSSVRALVQAMGIAHHFEALLGTDDFDFAYKPAEKAYLTVCRMLNVPPEQCIMIDDSAANLHAAKALGMRTVWYGQQTHDLPFVDFAAADMAALCAWAAEDWQKSYYEAGDDLITIGRYPEIMTNQ